MCIDAADHHWTVRLNDSVVARNLATLLSLKVQLTDHASAKKIADFPGKLRRDGALASVTTCGIDSGYSAPWGDVAMFHKEFRTSPGLVIFGRINVDSTGLERAGPIPMTICRTGGQT